MKALEFKPFWLKWRLYLFYIFAVFHYILPVCPSVVHLPFCFVHITVISKHPNIKRWSLISVTELISGELGRIRLS